MSPNWADETARQLLIDLSRGFMLKAHRDLDGHKDFRLHAPDGTSRPIERDLVQPLIDRRLIDSNQKFPVATFWLTEAGRRQIDSL